MKEKILNFITRRALKGTKFYPIREPFLPERDEIGLYVHAPFCKSLCPFCPYNRYLINKDLVKPYWKAVKSEFDIYRKKLGSVKINTLYIGGGTPTIMTKEITELVKYIRENVSVNEICIESNPSDLSDEIVGMLLDAGIKKLSMGAQSFDNEILRNIGRFSHDDKVAIDAIKRAVKAGFDTINVDMMFSLPGQTIEHLKKDLKKLVDLDVPQITLYPLLLFPYTKMAKDAKAGKINLPKEKEEKKMYEEIVDFLIDHNYELVAIWSFAKKGIEKYGSVEREEYIGIGAGAMTVTNLGTYSNTFPVEEYVNMVNKGKLPIAFGHKSTKEETMVHWFLMRLYEFGFRKKDFYNHFGVEIEEALGPMFRAFKLLKIVRINDNAIEIPSSAFYSWHLITKTFLSTYISRICEEGLKKPWPKEFKI
jgi:oxygen-independent coproporphyrinogen-3 oxidase